MLYDPHGGKSLILLLIPTEVISHRSLFFQPAIFKVRLFLIRSMFLIRSQKMGVKSESYIFHTNHSIVT